MRKHVVSFQYFFQVHELVIVVQLYIRPRPNERPNDLPSCNCCVVEDNIHTTFQRPVCLISDIARLFKLFITLHYINVMCEHPIIFKSTIKGLQAPTTPYRLCACHEVLQQIIAINGKKCVCIIEIES